MPKNAINILIGFVIVFFAFALSVGDAQAQSMTKSQKKAVEKRMEVMAKQARIRDQLSNMTTYQDATDCTAALMEVGIDGSKASSLSELQAHAQKIGMWQNLRVKNAKAEGRIAADLTAENYCDNITGGCQDEDHLSSILKQCDSKVKQAKEAAEKAEKA